MDGRIDGCAVSTLTSTPVKNWRVPTVGAGGFGVEEKCVFTLGHTPTFPQSETTVETYLMGGGVVPVGWVTSGRFHRTCGSDRGPTPTF